ncbi:unnamed protein product [Victoria cruziana]
MKAMVPELSLGAIYRGVIPFYVVDLRSAPCACATAASARRRPFSIGGSERAVFEPCADTFEVLQQLTATLVLQRMVGRHAGRCEIESQAAAVGGRDFGLQEAALAQAMDQPGQLALVASQVHDQIGLRGAGVACIEAQHSVFHMGEVGAGGQRRLTPGAEQVHDGVEGLEDLHGRGGEGAGAPTEGAESGRRVQRVRYEIKRRELEVAQVTQMSPNFVSVTLKGPDLADFASAGFDDHVKFMVDDGSGTGELARRDYTPRKFDTAKQELVIEFALHERGAASDWARQAAVGQKVLVGGPRGSMVVPTDYAWHVLVGDESALPAIHRRLEELPAGAKAIVRLLAIDAADRRELQSAAALDVQWSSTPQEWLDAVRALALPACEGYVWCAGEASVMAQMRDVLLVEKKHPKDNLKVAAYWKKGSADFHENL